MSHYAQATRIRRYNVTDETDLADAAMKQYAFFAKGKRALKKPRAVVRKFIAPTRRAS
ncbi:MAG TPA: hypothetical protein VGJ29_08985 [Vicinamibacterales bacterium]|jgi:hypothetical protein